MYRPPPRKLRVHLVRHAQSTANVASTHVGGVDAMLTDHGKEQAARLGEFFRQVEAKFDIVQCSTYQRARDTARITMAAMGTPDRLITYDERLVEMRRGDWEGKPIEAIYTEEERRRMDLLGMDHGAPGGETFHQVAGRMYEWLLALLCDGPEWDGQREVLVFSHGHAHRSLLQRVLLCDPYLVWRMMIGNTSITTIRHDAFGWGLEQLNAQPHMPGWKSSR